jgi:hypothetical protein
VDTRLLISSLDPLDTSTKKKKRLHAMVSAMYYVTFEERYHLAKQTSDDEQTSIFRTGVPHICGSIDHLPMDLVNPTSSKES